MQEGCHLRITLTPETRIVPLGVSRFKVGLRGSDRGTPRSLQSRASRLPSKNTLISDRLFINVIDDAKNRMKSNGVGAGTGSRNGMVKVVHLSGSAEPSEGIAPRRARS